MDDLDDILFSDKIVTKEKVGNMVAKKTKKSDKLGVGLDVGTGWLCSAGNIKNKMDFTPLRDCFYSIDSDMFSKSMFNKDAVKYVEHDGLIHIVGEDALTLAKIQNGSSLRPLAKGVINPNERSAAPILREMIKYCVEKYKTKKGEKLVFSVPAALVGSDDGFNVEYHQLSLSSLIHSLGYEPVPLNEAYAVIISELEKAKEITGLGFSFGAGLVNVAFVYKGMLLFEFSVNKSGDFIDQESSRACGVSEAMMNHIKENDLDLEKNEFEASPEERALIFTHRHVIKNTIQNVMKAFTQTDNINIIEPVPVIISGGTSLPNGFVEMFTKEIGEANLPFDITKIIPAKNKLTAVAKGCCIYANSLESNK